MPGRTTPSGPGPILNDPVPAPPGLAAGDVEAAGASAMDMLNGQVHIFTTHGRQLITQVHIQNHRGVELAEFIQ